MGVRLQQRLIEIDLVRFHLVDQERVGLEEILVDRLALTPKHGRRTLRTSRIGLER